MCAQPIVRYLRLVQEFYANAFRVENDDLGKYKTLVRAVPIDYSPHKIRAFYCIEYDNYWVSNFHSRWATDSWDHEGILNTLCIGGSQWVLDSEIP